MSDTPERPEHTPSVQKPVEGDAVTRDLGLRALQRLSAMIRLGRSYQPENQVFQAQLDAVMNTFKPLLEARGEVTFVSLDYDLYLNGERLPVRVNNARTHKHVMEEFRRRGIAGFRIQRGVGREELYTFFRLFNQPEVYAGTDLLEACLAHGLDHILPAIHASTEAPVENPDYDAGWLRTEATMADLTGTATEWEGNWSNPHETAGHGEGHAVGAPAEDEPQEPDDGFHQTGGVIIKGGAEGGGPGAPRGAARKAFSLAMQNARSLLTATSLQSGVEMRHAKRVVQPLVDGAFADRPAVVGLSSLHHRDEYTYAHAVNTCLVAVSMGHFLEMDRAALADLGVAALLHDVGKAAVGDKIEHPFEEFTPEERALAERHPLEGAKLIARSTTLNPTTLRCIRVALEHHMAPDGTGYPNPEGRWTTSLMSRIVAIADCYVSLQTHRSARGAYVTPYEALGMMLGPLKPRFHPAMLWALVQTVGFYPASQMVELDDRSLAVVLAPNANDLERPHLRLLFGPDRQALDPTQPIEFRPLPKERRIVRALPGREYPEDLTRAA